jgi:hypothetical protein
VRFKISTLIVLIFVLCSCKDKDRFANKIKTIDSLHTLIEKKITDFKSIDTLKLNSCLNEYYSNLKLISDSLKDTLSINYLEVFNKYKSCEAPMQFITENYKSILNESLLSKQQLKKLSDDLKNDVIEDEFVFEYFSIEKMEAEKMSEALSSNYNLAKETSDTFLKYNKKIQLLIRAIETQKP